MCDDLPDVMADRGADACVDRKIRDAMERTQAATVAKVRDLVERGGHFSASFGV